jgi:hypothetical protein
MNHRMLATTIAVIFAVSASHGVAAKGAGGHSGAGHSGGGHSSGGHAGSGHANGGHASGGHSSARSSGGQARAGGGARSAGGSQPTAAPAGTVRGSSGQASSGGRPTAGGVAAVVPAQGRAGSRSPDGRLVVGTAVTRSASARTVLVSPTLYPPIFRPHFVGFGFNYGLRHLGYGYGASFYGLAYDRPLLCDEMIDCYGPPAYGAAVDVAPPYASPSAPPEGDAATIVLQVQPSAAQIFVDGQFVGTVDDLRSELIVAAGVHRVEFRAPGYDPLVVDVRVDGGRRITYRGALKPSV